MFQNQGREIERSASESGVHLHRCNVKASKEISLERDAENLNLAVFKARMSEVEWGGFSGIHKK